MPLPPALPQFATRVLPVVVITNPDHAVPMARALLAGGIDAIEITLRHPSALESLARVAREVPDMVVGAGTLLTPADVDRVLSAGARFALAPGATPALLDAAAAAGLPFVPGVMTPSEAMAARDRGYRLLKLFPAAQAGGLAMLKALGSPLPDLRFCPTGGVSAANLAEFLAQPNVALAGGSWLTPAAAAEAGDWNTITSLAREACAIAVRASGSQA
ncbi:MAG TPA: bifunctional 4-hydroxy-2-oxoglutarate aldolase/2-dehydro-3-deoxy-phosphogluconate aldolase [Rhodocyclaceae bacterium]|nr:bifunctional 4-hydroxy-2-oxoglutarate aldolase/2-dehydro-3-deoxy-phosphogluconate aldolase [Rhodocyclaceae bacterium]